MTFFGGLPRKAVPRIQNCAELALGLLTGWVLFLSLFSFWAWRICGVPTRRPSEQEEFEAKGPKFLTFNLNYLLNLSNKYQPNNRKYCIVTVLRTFFILTHLVLQDTLWGRAFIIPITQRNFVWKSAEKSWLVHGHLDRKRGSWDSNPRARAGHSGSCQ